MRHTGALPATLRVRTDRPPLLLPDTLYVVEADYPAPTRGFRQYPLPSDVEDFDILMGYGQEEGEP